METYLEIMLEQDPVEGRQRETNGDRPANHVGTGPSRRETKRESGDRPGNHVGTGSSKRETKRDKWRQTWKSSWNRIQ